jgi:hypothetical protein
MLYVHLVGVVKENILIHFQISEGSDAAYSCSQVFQCSNVNCDVIRKPAASRLSAGPDRVALSSLWDCGCSHVFNMRAMKDRHDSVRCCRATALCGLLVRFTCECLRRECPRIINCMCLWFAISFSLPQWDWLVPSLKYRLRPGRPDFDSWQEFIFWDVFWPVVRPTQLPVRWILETEVLLAWKLAVHLNLVPSMLGIRELPPHIRFQEVLFIRRDSFSPVLHCSLLLLPIVSA